MWNLKPFFYSFLIFVKRTYIMFEQIFFHTQSLDGEINTFVTKKKKKNVKSTKYWVSLLNENINQHRPHKLIKLTHLL